nr:low-density lipoprotein receptor-related protein 8-like [Anas platyrhynchos]
MGRPPPLRLLLILAALLPPPGARRAPPGGPPCAATRQAACGAGCGPVPWLCDGERQCPNGTDEMCDAPCGGDPHAWQCDDGRCVSSSWRCDGAADCPDGSDEQDCVCGAKKLQCPGTHHCIPHWELCDRHQDCEDGWDEEGCPLQPCLPGQWQCRNRVCIAAEWKCNGVDDCGDSSDEDVCAPCPAGMVRCDEGKCILESLMCNDEDDCLDGTDEPSTCGRSCFVRNGGCAETCADTHWGVQCSCGAGWVLQSDGQSCADVDECSLEYSPCSQLCRNTPGSFSCSCLQGYTLRHGTICEVADNSTQLLVAVGEDLALLDVRTQAYRPLLSTETEPRALVYDLLRETYYWLTEEGELCAHHPGKGARLLYADAGEVNSISVDWFTGQLYWASSHPAAICAGLGDGRGYVRVLGKDVAPEQLTVYPAARSLYWVNRGQRGRTVIAAAGMDGSNRRELTVVSMEEPVGLSLDYVAGRLYWISEYKESIETLRVDGSGRHSFPSVLRSHTEPLGLAVFESRFFWADWHRAGVRQQGLSPGARRAAAGPRLGFHGAARAAAASAGYRCLLLRVCAATSASCPLCTPGAISVPVQRASTSCPRGSVQSCPSPTPQGKPSPWCRWAPGHAADECSSGGSPSSCRTWTGRGRCSTGRMTAGRCCASWGTPGGEKPSRPGCQSALPVWTSARGACTGWRVTGGTSG